MDKTLTPQPCVEILLLKSLCLRIEIRAQRVRLTGIYGVQSGHVKALSDIETSQALSRFRVQGEVLKPHDLSVEDERCGA